MAVSGAVGAGYGVIRMKYTDKYGMKYPYAFYTTNTAGDIVGSVPGTNQPADLTALGTFFTKLDAATNATIQASYQWIKPVVLTGFKSSPTTTQGQQKVTEVIENKFVAVNPSNSLLTWSEEFPIPAYTETNTDGTGGGTVKLPLNTKGNADLNTADTNVSGIVTFLQTYLAGRFSGDGMIHSGFTLVDSAGVPISIPVVSEKGLTI